MEDIIRAAVRAVGGNQADLARKIGVTQSSVSRWVSGSATPDFESCLALAEIIGASPDDILVAAGHDVRLLQFIRRTAPREQEATAQAQTRQERIDVELDSRMRRLVGRLSRHPRPFWLAIVEASERLAEVGDTLSVRSEPPVSVSREGPLSAPERRLNRGRRASDRDLSTGQHVLAALFRTPALATS